MEFDKLTEIKKQLDQLDAKSYTLTISSKDRTTVTIQKSELENKTIGFKG